MSRHLLRVVSIAVVAIVIARTAKPLIMLHKTGMWPKDWPQELESLRKSARTIDVGTGIQQRIYEIKFTDRAEFERAWPAILKIKTPHPPLTLHKVKPGDDSAAWLSDSVPAVRIYAPTEGFSVMPGSDYDVAVGQRVDPQARAKAIEKGHVLKCGPPWPDHIVDERGGLPEYVKSVKENSRIRWVSAQRDEDVRGFKNRARVDVHLVVDGEVVDLNRIPLPADTTVIDLRHRSTVDEPE